MSNKFTHLKSWSNVRITKANADNDDELSTAKFTELWQCLKEKKAEEEWKKAKAEEVVAEAKRVAEDKAWCKVAAEEEAKQKAQE